MTPELRSRIQSIVDSKRVVLFMKGTRQQPRCRFSATVAGILDDLSVDWRDVDVLAEPDLRDGIKEFSSWPTLPQLFVEGELIGGSDIVREMYAKGELQTKLGVIESSDEPPRITITDAAAEALREAAGEAE